MYLMNNETQWVIIINTEIFLHVILWHVETMKWGGLMSMAEREIVGVVCYLNPWKVPGPLITVIEILACGTRKRLSSPELSIQSVICYSNPIWQFNFNQFKLN